METDIHLTIFFFLHSHGERSQIVSNNTIQKILPTIVSNTGVNFVSYCQFGSNAVQKILHYFCLSAILDGRGCYKKVTQVILIHCDGNGFS